MTKTQLAQTINKIQGKRIITDINKVTKKQLVTLYNEILEYNKEIISMNKAKTVINNSKGKFITVVFTKNDNSLRKMTARTGVSKYVTGQGKAFNDDEKGIQTVFEPYHPAKGKQTGKQCYRSFRYDRLKTIVANHKKYEVI